jgi:cytochrome d ubiquinol oxidase subunit II
VIASLTAADATAVVLWVGVIAYAVFGGADFGAGFWDLLAGGPERGERPRALIDRAITPVWEANHVWLIFCLVMLWTAFSAAFTAIMTTLTLPLGMAAVGIVLRGAGFAFRKVSVGVPRRRMYGAAFAASSVITPFAMGTIAGGVASGRVPLGNGVGDRWTSWLNPTSLLGGVLAVAVCAYLSAVLLVGDARRYHDRALTRYFIRRAVGAAVATGIVATAGVFVLHADARPLFDELLLGRALPLVIISVISGGLALGMLVRPHPRNIVIRLAAASAVAAVVGVWGVAQYPYLLPGQITIDQAAAPSSTLGWLIGVAVVAVLLVVPSLALLYLLDQRSLLGDAAHHESP